MLFRLVLDLLLWVGAALAAQLVFLGLATKSEQVEGKHIEASNHFPFLFVTNFNKV
jgi:hypothetical protein